MDGDVKTVAARPHEEDTVAARAARASSQGGADPLTEAIIGAAIEVHRHLGPGLLESTYEQALCVELELRGLALERQKCLPIEYKGHLLGEYRLDLLVAGAVVVEVKSVDRLDPIFDAQVLTYLRATGCRRGLLVNFNTRLMRDGIRRLVL